MRTKSVHVKEKKKKKVSSTIDRFIGQGIFNKTMNLEQRWGFFNLFFKTQKTLQNTTGCFNNNRKHRAAFNPWLI